MRIIRDDSPFGNIFTTALGIDWDIRRCNIEGCTETILGAIIAGIPDTPTFGVCEYHYHLLADTPGAKNIKLDFAPLWYIGPDDEFAVEWRLNGG